MSEIQIYNKPLTAVEIRANVNLIQEVMKSVMKKDVHYGVIPGTQKPTLYKAGSEKILATFRIAVDLDVEDLSRSDCFRYRVKARGVLPSGEIVGCGIGECSTDEEKYKWRGVVCPAEWEATPEDRKRIKYVRVSNYNKEGMTQQIRTNPADLANTVLKMAKKRAQIDLTLTATGASDVFDQDIEDLPEGYVEGMQGDKPQGGKPVVSQPTAKSQKQVELTEWQAKYYPRIEAALTTLFNSDQTAKDEKLIELTTWTKDKGKETEKIVDGTPNYQGIKTEKTLEILAHKLETLVSKMPKADDTPTLCSECMQPEINGACRNTTCCEYRSEDE